MVLALLMLSLLSILGLSAISNSVFSLKVSGNYRQSVEALLVAEAGLEHAKSVLRAMKFRDALAGPDGNPAAAADNGIIFAGGSNLAFQNGAYAVIVSDNDDGDGDPARDSDQRIIVTSTGTLNGSNVRKIISATLSKANLGSPPGAVSILDNQYELYFDGNSFTINGNDKALDGKPGAEPAISGIAIESAQPTQAEIDNFFNTQNADRNIVGSGGATPDIVFGDTPLELSEIQKIRDRLAQMATVRYTGATSISSETALGTTDNPQITYVNDSLTLSGVISGAGILIVDKDLVITGNVRFDGIILVGICPTCPGRVEQISGNIDLYGSLLIANTTSQYSNEARLSVNGNVSFYYSSEAIDNALAATFAMESWREVL